MSEYDTLPADTKKQIEAIRSATTGGFMGGGYNTSESIPAQKDSLYDRLNATDKMIVTKKVDNLTSEAFRSGTPLGYFDNKKGDVEKYVQEQRKELSAPEKLKALKSEAEQIQKAQIQHGRG